MQKMATEQMHELANLVAEQNTKKLQPAVNIAARRGFAGSALYQRQLGNTVLDRLGLQQIFA